jgi:hypothetical protein
MSTFIMISTNYYYLQCEYNNDDWSHHEKIVPESMNSSYELLDKVITT